MASTTGIELGPDSCVLAAARPADRAGVANVQALHVIERQNWPSQDFAVVTALSSVRRAKKFPRRARVVVWGLTEPVSPADPIAVALIRPITQAGFKVERVLTPPEGLAMLAASRPRPQGDGAVAWLSLNMHGAAIAIVRGPDLLFARTFSWSYNPMAAGQKAQLLQRYSLVAQLAPELRRGITVVRDSAGVTVDAAITCGDLPELRSLTMPLIEELDLEVETLDSTEGLRAVGKAKGERFAESAPAVRLACAVAAARARRSSGGGESPLRFAAALALAGGLIWAAYAVSTLWLGGSLVPARSAAVQPAKPVVAPSTPRNPSSAPPAATLPSDRRGAPPPGAPPSSGRGVVVSRPEPVTPVVQPSVTTPPVKVSPPPANPSPAPPASSSVPVPVGQNAFRSTRMPISAMGGSSSTARVARPAVIASRPVPPASAAPTPGGAPARPAITAVPASPEPVLPKPSISAAAPRPPAVAIVRPPAGSTTPPGSKPVPPATPSSAPPAATSAGASVSARVTPPLPPVPSPPVPRPAPPRPVAEAAPASPSPRAVPPTWSAAAPPPRSAGSARTPVAARPPSPLTEPLPRIESILMDQERRLAIVDGGIVGIGDAVGQRIVTSIDRDGVVFREPSGLAIRVSLRSRAG